MRTILKPLAIALTATLAGFLSEGCVMSPVNLAWRGTIDSYDQKATTEGAITNKPRKNDTSVNAEKTTDVTADVPISTSKGTAAKETVKAVMDTDRAEAAAKE